MNCRSSYPNIHISWYSTLKVLDQDQKQKPCSGNSSSAVFTSNRSHIRVCSDRFILTQWLPCQQLPVISLPVWQSICQQAHKSAVISVPSAEKWGKAQKHTRTPPGTQVVLTVTLERYIGTALETSTAAGRSIYCSCTPMNCKHSTNLWLLGVLPSPGIPDGADVQSLHLLKKTENRKYNRYHQPTEFQTFFVVFMFFYVVTL